VNRRDFIRINVAFSVGGMAFNTEIDPVLASLQEASSNLKITAVKMVRPRPKDPLPSYEPSPGSWNVRGTEVANPMSIYPKYKANRALFMADSLGPEAVEITTDKGMKGLGYGGPGASFVVERHLTKLLIGENPFDLERLWDIMWRSTLYYGRKGLVIHAISAVDNALWDLVGKVLGVPVYRLLGGATKERIPAYCTGNDIEQHVEFGFKKLKLAIPYGPADGRDGIRKNVELVKRARECLGPDGEVMLDCWMAFTEEYTLELAGELEPYRVYWIEECLPPDDYAGFGRLNRRIQSTRIATGEHEYTRYGFRQLLEYEAADIWQPDMNWCGGLSELRHIGKLAASHDIPVIPHGGWRGGCPHFILASTNSPWCEMFMPPPGGPEEVYRRFEEDNLITRGKEGIYMRPSEKPGLGWNLVS
jgi:L-rhamnonate dehydratase